MKIHPYLRAYVAGIFMPTLVLPLILVGFISLRLVIGIQVSIERFVIFPMAVVPFMFGLWNMVYLATHDRTRLPLGVHGAILPFLGAPIGALVANWLGVLQMHGDGILSVFRSFTFLTRCWSVFFWAHWLATTWYGSTSWAF